MKKLERITPEQIEELRKRIGNRFVLVCSDIVRQLFCEIDRLRMELKPLAKTANGVPMYIGMAVWTLELKGMTHWKILQIDDGSVRLIAGSGVVFTRYLREVFSSPGAVEKGGEG